jgi:hypothetical protein
MKLPQLSLRELFLLVALVAMGCGWWRDREQIHRREQEATENEARLSRREANIQKVLKEIGLTDSEYPELRDVVSHLLSRVEQTDPRKSDDWKVAWDLATWHQEGFRYFLALQSEGTIAEWVEDGIVITDPSGKQQRIDR